MTRLQVIGSRNFTTSNTLIRVHLVSIDTFGSNYSNTWLFGASAYVGPTEQTFRCLSTSVARAREKAVGPDNNQKRIEWPGKPLGASLSDNYNTAEARV